MKKLLSLFLVLVMVFTMSVCLSACGEEEDDDVRGKITSESDDDKEKDEDKNKDNEEQNAQKEPTSAQPEFSVGKTSKNTYTNDFLGISCTLSSDWEFYSEKQILELNNIAAEALDEETKKVLENANIVYDMYASNSSDFSTINVNLEKLSAAQLKNLNIKQTLESQFAALKSGLENMGYTGVAVEYSKVMFGGKEVDGVKVEGNYSGVNFYETIVCIKKGNYLSNITVASFETDKGDEILGYFSYK